ncbi:MULTISPECIES: hypothetical protein [unclassified Microbacterium]|uniref:hypothetical protein n=1 Tax=unclassified Microbacterium TaxID=2609290 RepID=UPI00386E0491
MRATRASRVLRGGLAASVATWVALLSHVTAGGTPPGWLGVAAPLALSLALCTALAGRRLSLIRLAIAVTLSQVLFHTLFLLGTVTPSGSAAPHAHAHLALPAMTDAAGSAAALHGDLAMWALHGLAALVTTLVLHRGERAARALLALASDLARWLRRRLIAATGLLTPLAWPALPAAVAAERPPRSPFLAVIARRGPPALAR